METKRIILAVALSIAIFMGWNFVARQMGWLPPPPEPAAHNATAEAGKAPPAPALSGQASADPTSIAKQAPSAASAGAAFMPTKGRLITVETPLYKAVLHSNGGVLRQFYLKQYRTSMKENAPLVNLVSEKASEQAPMGILLNGLPTWFNNDWTFEGDNLQLAQGATGTLRFIGEANGVKMTRELSFSGSAYTIKERLGLSASEAQSVNVAFTSAATPLAVNETPGIFARLSHLIFGGAEPVAGESQYNLTRVAWYQNGSFDETDSVSDLTAGKLVEGKASWMGVMNNYFIDAVSMNDPTASAKGRYVDGVYLALIGKTGIALTPNAESSLDCTYFIGPKEAKRLNESPNHLEKALDYGFFTIVAKPLVFLLQFLYSYVHNYGVAIILMTIIIKALFWPLSQKSYRSMQQMKQLQPLIVRIREKFADDKEAMNREIMQLYKTYKVNPAGGCLPILIQLPVFIGLYNALLNAIELRHAPFITHLPFTDSLWLADLASPDPFFITPLVMGATMLVQQKLTPAPGDPTQARIMMLMPIVFTGLFLTFPSGLVIYWLINNVISIGQQWWQMRRGT